MTTIDEQIAAVRWALERGENEAAHNRYPQDPELTWLRAALGTLERHKLALAVVEAARVYLDASLHAPSIVNAFTDMENAVSAFDIGAKPR